LLLALCAVALFAEWPLQVAVVGSNSSLDRGKNKTKKLRLGEVWVGASAVLFPCAYGGFAPLQV
jgi:hypothetical protein